MSHYIRAILLPQVNQVEERNNLSKTEVIAINEMAMCEPFPEGLFEEQEALRMRATPPTPPPSRQRSGTTIEEGNRIQRPNEIRRHSTSAANSAFHAAANKLREAKQKLKDKLTRHEHQITDEELARAAQKRDELKEKERKAERRASDAAEDYDRLVSKQLLQKCHEADNEAAKMHTVHHIHARTMEIH